MEPEEQARLNDAFNRCFPDKNNITMEQVAAFLRFVLEFEEKLPKHEHIDWINDHLEGT